MQVADKNKQVRGTILLAILCALLQLALAPNVGIGNGRANFALVFAGVVALGQGGRRGVVLSFLAGLFFDLCSTEPIGLMACCLTVSSLLLGVECRNRIAGDLAGSMALFCGSAAAVSLVQSLAMLLVGQASSLLDVIVLRALPTALLTCVAFVPFAYYYSRVRAAGPNLGRGGGHFSTKGL